MAVMQASALAEEQTIREEIRYRLGTSEAADERRRGDQEIAAALATGVLFNLPNSPPASGDSEVARIDPPRDGTGAGPGLYWITWAYRDLLSWPVFVFDALIAGTAVPEPWGRALRPAHKIAAEMFGSMMDRGGKMQAACAREITDRVEGPVIQKTEASVTISHVLVTPGRYQRPVFDAQVVTDAQVLPSDED